MHYFFIKILSEAAILHTSYTKIVGNLPNNKINDRFLNPYQPESY